MSLNKIKSLAQKHIKQNPHIRYGQAVFNISYELYPNATDELRASEFDCFYDDEKVLIFLEKLDEILKR
ncbi:hypothetical protein [Campylobacter gastrosuis]|uniref:Uncharacterized protein n=1 Tax=Campylobacter gastrosuis TaxID=2974576 RepID=A0ABT7HRL3_9BACT|nr:hypothetical protein [Campylobacter gastrosuis]MDL0089557.1 hypothetical protein [Campylobacter gastrosuis]